MLHACRKAVRTHQKFVLTVIFVFICCPLSAPPVAAQEVDLKLPSPSQIKPISKPFAPVVLKAVTVNPQDPFLFDFLIDKGDADLSAEALEAETQKLVKYFLAALTIPEADLWVNLSPYEQDAMVPQVLGITELGKDLLVDDYMLKQVAAGMTNPNTEIGKKFWKTAYARAKEQFGTTEVPINTFSKVWIVPDNAVVLEQDGSAFVADSYLKVYLDEDYLAVKNNLDNKAIGTDKLTDDRTQAINNLSAQVMKEIVLPEIEKEVNTGKNFVLVRQIYNSAILAAWYKKRLKESILGQLYADKGKVAGVNADDMEVGEKIFNKYASALKAGVYNIVKQDYDLSSQKILQRKYFSGGFDGRNILANTAVRAMTPAATQALSPRAASALTSAVAAVSSSATRADGSSKFAKASVSLRRTASTTVKVVEEVKVTRNTGLSPIQALARSTSAIPGTRDALLVTAFLGTSDVTDIDATLKSSPNPSLRNLSSQDSRALAQALQNVARSKPSAFGDAAKLNQALSETLPAVIATNAALALSVPNELNRIANVQQTLFVAEQNTENALPYVDVSTLGRALASINVREPEVAARRFIELRTSQPTVARSAEDLSQADPELGSIISQAVRSSAFQQAVRPYQPTTPPQVRALVFATQGEIVELLSRQSRDTVRDAQATVERIEQLKRSNPAALGDLNSLRAVDPVLAQEIEGMVAVNAFSQLETKYLTPVTPNQAEIKYLADRMYTAIPRERRGNIDTPKLEAELTKAVRSGVLNDPAKVTAREYPILNRVLNPRNAEFNEVRSVLVSLPGIESRAAISTVDYIRNIFSSDASDEDLRRSINSYLPAKFTPEERDRLSADIVNIRRHSQADRSFRDQIMLATNVTDLQKVVRGAQSESGLNPVSATFAKLDDSDVKQLGGIDLSAERMGLKIKVDGKGVVLPISQQDIENMKIDGLAPVILDVQPATLQNTPFLMNLAPAASK